ncbi:MAG: 1-acyl-sn-glycerol-3-phosphate acyltransferase [Clostridia bacterium]|nr:1-acyl-sn-glycerol-3-phosphate acyltransferase [Clostridia bacterium]MBO7296152.1 1-acyl-sn-glycerol-3-phosphate acyltransferase [Clostridia bacterium]
MLLELFLTLGALCSVLTVFLKATLVTSIFDIWIPIVLWLGYSIGFFALYALGFVLLSLFVDKSKPQEKPNHLYLAIFVETIALYFRLARIEIRVRGKEKLPQDGNFLLVSNHLSDHDFMSMLTVLRGRSVAFVSKPENFNYPIVGKYLHKGGFLPINREQAREALTTIRAVAERMKTMPISYGVFPEGTRNRQVEGLLPFREGVFLMAKKADVPIVIVRVTDTDKVKHRAPWRKTRVYVDFVDVIDTETVRAARSHELSEMVRERMAAAEGLPRVPKIRRTFKYGNN